MIKKRLLKAFVSLALIAATILPVSAFADDQLSVKIESSGAILIEGSTGIVLQDKNAHKKLPMASTTKIMTALVAIENGNLDEVITTDAKAYGVEGSSMYIQKNEKIALRDLLYGLMLTSGNDAAVAIACHIGGSVEGFAEMMNQKAASLGLQNSNFVTPNGLHNDEHYTTAYDLAMITRAAMANETFREIVSTTYYTTQSGNMDRTLKNKNKMLWQYEGGTGVKTGYTSLAGKCLVFSAMRDGMELIGVVLHSPNTFNEATRLLNYGFNEFSMVKLVTAGQTIATAEVQRALSNPLKLTVGEDILVPVGKTNGLQVTTRVNIPPDIVAPVKAGDQYGVLEIWAGNNLITTKSLVAAEEIRTWGFKEYLEELFEQFNK